VAIDAVSALTTPSYLNPLAPTGSGNQTMALALAQVASQAQIAQATTLFSSTSTTEAFASLAGASGLQALAAYNYNSAAASGNGVSAVQSLLSSLNGGLSAQMPTADSLPLSTALLAPNAASALARYAYDQSQNQSAFATQAVSAGQQSLLTSGWNLLV
jgi:hypothetical protein